MISGYHDVTRSVELVQEDHDFHTKALGIKSVKRTVLFDGTIPVYHLYDGNPAGDPSTIVTTFPFRKPGIFGRRGTNQSRIIQLAIPRGASDFGVNRLNARGIPAAKSERFGLLRVSLQHPCGIPHELVESPADPRAPITADGIGAAQGIKGIHGVAIAVFDRTSMDDFLTVGMGMTKEADDASGLMFWVPAGLAVPPVACRCTGCRSMPDAAMPMLGYRLGISSPGLPTLALPVPACAPTCFPAARIRFVRQRLWRSVRCCRLWQPGKRCLADDGALYLCRDAAAGAVWCRNPGRNPGRSGAAGAVARNGADHRPPETGG